jgi:hypothetical protein
MDNKEPAKKKLHPVLIIFLISVGIDLLMFCLNHLGGILTRGYWNRGDFTAITIFFPIFIVIWGIWVLTNLGKKDKQQNK